MDLYEQISITIFETMLKITSVFENRTIFLKIELEDESDKIIKLKFFYNNTKIAEGILECDKNVIDTDNFMEELYDTINRNTNIYICISNFKLEYTINSDIPCIVFSSSSQQILNASEAIRNKIKILYN